MRSRLMANALLLLTSLVFLLVNLSQSSHHEQRLPYMTSDVEEVSGKSFDYIIVGGGTAGCPLAATLSQRFKVLLVERGGSPYGNPLIWNKAYYGVALLRTDDFSSVAQRFISEDGVPSYRGRVLGGSSAINGAFYSRASADSVKRNRWDKELVKEAYEWVESKIVFKPELTVWQSIIKNGLIEAGFVPYNGFTWEHIVGTKIGGSIYDRFGVRHTAADLLRAGNSENITVLLHATVKNIIFREDGNEKVAHGIRFTKSNSSDNRIYEAYLNRRDESSSGGDVILSAGALGSPQILMLSGIGPAEHLRKFDIPLVLVLQGVGHQMQDNPALRILADEKQGYRLQDPGQVAGIAKEFKFISEGGIVSKNLNATSTTRRISIKLAFPESTGKLRLNSTDPRKNPSVKFNYLTTENDLDNCMKMAQVLLKISRSKSVAPYVTTEAKKKPISRPEELRGFCKKNVTTFYHYHGGCNVGSVVDDDYKVYGVKGLRVIDGSTFSESPGTNPMATVLMLGRYQGIKILKENEPTYLFDGPKQP